MALLISTFLLAAFAVLAIVDGFYLHIFKYELHNHDESKFEHLTHTARAVLFPLIVYFLFVQQNSPAGFCLGVIFVAIDILVLGLDAFAEKDSRAFMGGLPRWEYILHLFVNGFHFASIAVFLALKLEMADGGIVVIADLSKLPNFELFQILAQNLVPGAVLLALIHVLTSIDSTKVYWNGLRARVACCQ